MIGSALFLAAFFFIFKAEATKNRRLFLAGIRGYLDRKIERQRVRWQIWKRYVGASSFRLFLHFLFHQALGLILFLNRKTEELLSRLRHHNRLLARTTAPRTVSGHLGDIAAHKASTALSEEEKLALKERRLTE